MNRCREYARLMRKKAELDMQVLRLLAVHEELDDTPIGFHAQQAVEKLFKALLSHCGVYYRKTHELSSLLRMLSDHGVLIPSEVEETCRLQRFAVQLRYPDDEPLERLDREWTMHRVDEVAAWGDAHLGSAEPDDDAARGSE